MKAIAQGVSKFAMLVVEKPVAGAGPGVGVGEGAGVPLPGFAAESSDPPQAARPSNRAIADADVRVMVGTSSLQYLGSSGLNAAKRIMLSKSGVTPICTLLPDIAKTVGPGRKVPAVTALVCIERL